MSGRVTLFLMALLVVSALSLVTSQYQSRRLFIELERAQAQARQIEIEWAQLQLDQSSLGTHARVESHAGRTLNMLAVTPTRTQYLTKGAR